MNTLHRASHIDNAPLLESLMRTSETSQKQGISIVFAELDHKNGREIYQHFLQNPHILKNLGIEKWFLSHGDKEGNANFYGNMCMGQTLYVHSHYHTGGEITDFFFMLPKDAPSPITSCMNEIVKNIKNIT